MFQTLRQTRAWSLFASTPNHARGNAAPPHPRTAYVDTTSPAAATRRSPPAPGPHDSAPHERLQFRTIWISDIHLGSRGCQAEMLLDFLRCTESETLYLVGDIVDGWRLKRTWYWPQSHNDVVQKVLRKVRKGTRVVYIPGNHDEVFRDYVDLSFGGIDVRTDCIHETVGGRRLLVMHGDDFDNVVRYARWLAVLGDYAYSFALVCNHLFNLLRRRLGLPYWSLSAFLKLRVKNAVSFISNFEETVVAAARRRHVDGVVCGHIHHAGIRPIGGMLYCNDGDWVESCTALVEDYDGELSVLHWGDRFASAGAVSLGRGAAVAG